MDGPVLRALAAGVFLGAANVWASQWVARRALRRRPAVAVEFLLLGFLVRLGLLALVVFTVPGSWLDAPTFVVTFLAAFFLGIAVEARLLRGERAAERKG